LATLHVNLFAAAGFGKSTLAEATSALLRRAGISVELVREHSKELHWQGRLWTTEQFLITAEQWRREAELEGKVAVVLTDSALPLGLLHAPASYRSHLGSILETLTAPWRRTDVLLERVAGDAYQRVGRDEDLAQACETQKEVRELVRVWSRGDFLTLSMDGDAPAKLLAHVLDRLDRGGNGP
jgi:thymidylate kinase